MFVLRRVRAACLSTSSKMSLSSMTPARFRPSRLEHVECAEDYRPGGLHPVGV
ncbi:hypothetical protein B0H34DRAFT_715747, partial [Crassisporium funariophilum]